MLCVTSLFYLCRPLLSETYAEHTQKIAVGGLDVNIGFDQSLPFLDHGPQLVSGEIHAMEIGHDISTLNVFGDEAEFAERNLVVLKVSEGDFEDAPF